MSEPLTFPDNPLAYRDRMVQGRKLTRRQSALAKKHGQAPAYLVASNGSAIARLSLRFGQPYSVNQLRDLTRPRGAR